MRGNRLAVAFSLAVSLLCGAVGSAFADETAAVDLKAAIEKLGAVPCATGSLTCVSIEVPLDHRANDPSKKLKLTFAVSFASEQSKGVLLYAVGGPGGSGLGVADDYLSAFDERLTQNMDIVFFDQRGVGAEHGIECPVAQATFDSADLSVDAPDAAIETAKGFVNDCMAELKSRDLLPYVATEQVIRDLELFRAAIGAPKVWVYGESYGTQVAQQYATAYPAAINGVVIDGVVDLSLNFGGYYASYTSAAERILERVLDSCGKMNECRADMKTGGAPRVYRELAKRLAQGPIELDFPLGDGTTVKRKLTSGMLDAIAFYALYGPDDRAAFLRVLAAASRGEFLPMLRLAYSTLVINPVTEQGTADPSWFGAAYYAVTCLDYAEGGADRDANARQIMAEAKAFAARAPLLARAYFAERLACAYWPNRGDTVRPKPFAGGDYPTLILNADTDPITPVSMSYSVLDHAKNSYLVVMKGGPHVIWGRGLTCPDEIVYGLLFDGTLPEAKEQLCEQDFIGAYEPLTLNPGEADDALVLARAVVTEIGQSPELYNWDAGDSLAVGCDHGGTLEVSAAEEGTAYSFAKCALWQGIILNGTGISIEEGAENVGLTLDLAVSGVHEGQITYRHNSATDTMTLNGTYDGKVVTTPRPRP